MPLNLTCHPYGRYLKKDLTPLQGIKEKEGKLFLPSADYCDIIDYVEKLEMALPQYLNLLKQIMTSADISYFIFIFHSDLERKHRENVQLLNKKRVPLCSSLAGSGQLGQSDGS